MRLPDEAQAAPTNCVASLEGRGLNLVLLPIGTGTGLWPGDGVVNEAPAAVTRQPSYFNIIGVGARFLPWKKLSPQL